MKIARFITLLTLSVLTSSSAVMAEGTSIGLEDVLWWLPTDSETLIVVGGAFSAPDLSSPRANLERMLQASGVGPIAWVRNREIYKPLIGQKILLSVVGSRRFRIPSGLGAMPYDGCHILIMENDVTAFVKSLNDPAANSLSYEEEGSKVLVFKERLENDDWLFYVTAPDPHVLVVTTDKRSLSDVLKRMKKRGETRAFPATLPEWKYVDQTAPFWAIRHYSSATAKDDPSSPLSPIMGGVDNRDSRAIGLTFKYRPADSGVVELTYLSASWKSADVARSYWTQPAAKLEPVVKPLKDNGVSITLHVSGKEEEASYFLWILLTALGHGVFI